MTHTSNTMYPNLIPCPERSGLTGREAIAMAAPMDHQTGFRHGLLMPICLGARFILFDMWDKRLKRRMVQDEGIAFTMASTHRLGQDPEIRAVQDAARGDGLACPPHCRRDRPLGRTVIGRLVADGTAGRRWPTSRGGGWTRPWPRGRWVRWTSLSTSWAGCACHGSTRPFWT
ncbi:hypothetical protein [Paracoccus sp. MC1854]|uniref:hypothetical protein n=1 Tax=Paracoccus sp. MC1854 TaxID=2760306 RepID=UPI002104B92D|nr:hypothetical protein [Paracoccus sp. MC1854]